MRSVSASKLTLLRGERYDTFARIRVHRDSSTYEDLSARMQELTLDLPNPSAPVAALDLTLIREYPDNDTTQSISPLINNTRNMSGGQFSPLLQIGREITVDIALLAVGSERPVDSSAAWDEVFRGILTSVDWGGYDAHLLQLKANDMGRVLTLAKSEVAYSYAAGSTVETAMAAILANNGFSGVDTWFPSATGKALLTPYEPGLQKTIWSQLWAVVTAFGWSMAYRYNDALATDKRRLTFFEPQRTKTTPDLTLSRWRNFTRLSIDERDIRNVGYVKYVDLSGKDQLVGPRVSQDSINKYGGFRRPFWIALTEESTVRTGADAAALLADAASDLSDPDAIATVVTEPMPYLEIGTDVWAFKERGRLFSDDQVLAPFSSQLVIPTDGLPYSTTSLRGRPTAGQSVWGSVSSIVPSVPSLTVITYAEVRVNHATGAVKLTGGVDRNYVNSIEYAYNVNNVNTGDPPTIAQADARGAGATGGGLITSTGFNADTQATCILDGAGTDSVTITIDSSIAAGLAGNSWTTTVVNSAASASAVSDTGAQTLTLNIAANSTPATVAALITTLTGFSAASTGTTASSSWSVDSDFSGGVDGDGTFTITLSAGTIDYDEAVRFVLLGYASDDASGDHGPPLGATGTRLLSSVVITYAEVRVNQKTGAVLLTGGVDTDVVKSIEYAYNVNAIDTGSPPTVAQAEARGTGASGGGLVNSFNTDGVFTITLAAGTVDYNEAIRFVMLGYTSTDGSGNHGPPIGATGSRPVSELGLLDHGIEAARALIEGSGRQSFTGTFSATDWDTVAWTAGTLTLTTFEDEDNRDDGTATNYSIVAGNTGNLSSDTPRYIYFDPDISTTVLQVAVASSSALPEDDLNRALVCVAWRARSSSGDCSFVPAKGQLVVRAAMLDVAKLSAISADIGTVYTGKIQDTADNPRFVLDLDAKGTDALMKLNDGEKDTIILQADGDAEFSGTVSANSFTGTLPVFKHGLYVRDGRATNQVIINSSSDQGGGGIDFYPTSGGARTGSISARAGGGLVFIPTGTGSVLQLSGDAIIGGTRIGFFGGTATTKRTIA